MLRSWWRMNSSPLGQFSPPPPLDPSRFPKHNLVRGWAFCCRFFSPLLSRFRKICGAPLFPLTKFQLKTLPILHRAFSPRSYRFRRLPSTSGRLISAQLALTNPPPTTTTPPLTLPSTFSPGLLAMPLRSTTAPVFFSSPLPETTPRTEVSAGPSQHSFSLLPCPNAFYGIVTRLCSSIPSRNVFFPKTSADPFLALFSPGLPVFTECSVRIAALSSFSLITT